MNRRRSSFHLWVAGGLFAGFVAIALALGLAPMKSNLAAHFHGTSYGEPEPAPAFVLTDHRGQRTGLDAFHGQVVLLFFGFTHCPDVCPLTLSRLGALTEELGRAADEVAILLITVDPERDTPAVLAEYVRRFGDRVTGLTGAADELERIRAAYGVYAERQAGHDAHDTMVHTTAVFGIDRSGRLRVLLHADGDRDALAADLRTLLRL